MSWDIWKCIDTFRKCIETFRKCLETFGKCMQHNGNPYIFRSPKQWLVSECLKTIGCLTKCVGNVHIAAPQICPFLKSRWVLSFGVIQSPKLPTENIKGPVKERGGPVNNLKCGTDTSTRNLSQTIPQDIWINDWMVLDQMEWLSDQIEGTNEMVWETMNQSVSQSVSEWVPKASSRDASASRNIGNSKLLASVLMILWRDFEEWLS